MSKKLIKFCLNHLKRKNNKTDYFSRPGKHYKVKKMYKLLQLTIKTLFEKSMNEIFN